MPRPLLLPILLPDRLGQNRCSAQVLHRFRHRRARRLRKRMIPIEKHGRRMSDEEREVGNEMRQFIIWRPRLRIATGVACAWNGLVFRCFSLIDSIRFPCTDTFSYVDFFFFRPSVTNPVLYSMISMNNLSDCYQIRDLYSKCQDLSSYKNSSSPQQPIICETAHKLFVSCHVSEK